MENKQKEAMIKMRAETNDQKRGKGDNKAKGWFFRKINKIDEPLLG